MTGRRWVRIAGRVLFVVSLLSAANAAAAGRPVTFRAADGRSVNAIIFEAGQRPSPAVVLVPMLGRGRDDWQAVGDRLAEANITALAIDLPGVGFPGDQQSLAAWHADVVAAVTFLASRPDVRPSSIGVAGASVGGSLAALAGAADARIRALALVSPSLDYRGVRIEATMKQFARPALLVASIGDPYAARSARELARESAGLREMRWSDVTAHGTVLLSRDPDTAAALVEWFRRTLG
jgi:dienelactone hydrolase